MQVEAHGSCRHRWPTCKSITLQGPFVDDPANTGNPVKILPGLQADVCQIVDFSGKLYMLGVSIGQEL